MLVLGIVAIVLAVLLLVAVLAGQGPTVHLFDGNLNVSPLVLFLAGAAALLLVVVGLGLVRAGLRRASSNRQTKKRLRKLERREELRRDETGAAPAAEPGAEPGVEPGASADPYDAERDRPLPGESQPGGTTAGEPRDGGPYRTPPPPPRPQR